MKKTALLALLLSAVSAGLVQAAAPGDFVKVYRSVENVSLISLIANPERYDGKPVRAIGAFRLEFEGKALCLHQDDLQYGISSNCLWIEPDFKTLGTDIKTLSQFNGQYVLLEGTFSKDDHGHRGAYSGALKGVWRVMPVRDRAAK